MPSLLAAALLLATVPGCSTSDKSDSSTSDDEGGDDDICYGYCDHDQDGHYAELGDCDDSDPDVNPDATEDCTNDIDDDCNGIATRCLDPGLIYEPTAPGSDDPYGVAVFADAVVFGEPQFVGSSPGDGEALFFELQEATVDESDAFLSSPGDQGEAGAYGVVLTPVGDALCIGADYQNYGVIDDVGKSWCYDEATVRGASGTLPTSSAAYTAKAQAEESYATVEAEADVDGDGNLDLLVYTAHNLEVIYGDGSPWTGDYLTSIHSGLSLGNCATSTSGWCGFGRAVTSTFIAIAEEGGPADPVSLFDLPNAGSTLPDATAAVDRFVPDAATGSEALGLAIFGNSLDDEVSFVDASGTVVGQLGGPEGSSFGRWVATFEDQDLHELLLVSAPDDSTGGSSGSGLVYVFDLSEDGRPYSTADARFELVPPDGMDGCGLRARGGIVSNLDGVATTVVLSCPGDGGAAFVLDLRPPVLPVEAIQPLGGGPGSGQFQIKQWVTDAYVAHLPWLLGLADVEKVTSAQGQVGWKLSSIEPGTPLYRAGLRNDDIVRKVNGNTLDSEEVVQTLFESLQGSTSLTLTVYRNGQVHTVSYDFVP